MTERTVLILANGGLGDAETLRLRLRTLPHDSVVAADGGARHAASLDLQVDLVIGDLDSLDPVDRQALQRHGATHVERPRAKDETDLELALLNAVGSGATRIVVLGGVGGRLDMTLANVGLLFHPSFAGTSIHFWNGHETAFALVPPGGELSAGLGDRISLIPFGGEVRGITTGGLAFPLDGETLRLGPARGVSNVVSRTPASVRFAAGALLVVHTPRSALPGD